MSSTGPDIDVPPGVIVGWVTAASPHPAISRNRNDFVGFPEESVHEASEYLKVFWPANDGLSSIENFVKERWEGRIRTHFDSNRLSGAMGRIKAVNYPRLKAGACYDRTRRFGIDEIYFIGIRPFIPRG